MTDEKGVVESDLQQTTAEIARPYARSVIRGGDLVISIGPSFGKVMRVPGTLAGANLTQGTARVAPSRSVSSDYLFWVLRSRPTAAFWDSASNGATFRALTLWSLAQTPVPLPPLPTQKAIADYLDEKTVAIDALIEKKRKLLDLLAEERAALVNQAVTKGLDPTVPMKDSGIPWIGEIPAHWEVRRVATISTKITNGYVGPTRDLFVDEGVPYLQSLHIKDNAIRFSPPYFVPPEWSTKKAKSVLATDDVLVVQTGDIGQVAVVPPDWAGANCHALIIITTNKAQMSGAFLSWALNSRYGFNSLKSIQTGALHPHLNCTLVRELVIPRPPPHEQSEIVQRIDRLHASFVRQRETVTKQIDRLQEYRQALITAAVTGQLDIGAAA